MLVSTFYPTTIERAEGHKPELSQAGLLNFDAKFKITSFWISEQLLFTVGKNLMKLILGKCILPDVDICGRLRPSFQKILK